MNSITHMTIGAAIGISTSNSTEAFFAGAISHVVLDQIPHTDQGAFMEAGESWPKWVWYSAYLDNIIAALIVVFFITHCSDIFWPRIICGAIGGISIDIIDNVPFWSKKFQKTCFGSKFHQLHDKFHATVPRKYWALGVISQLIFIIGGLWFLSKKLL